MHTHVYLNDQAFTYTYTYTTPKRRKQASEHERVSISKEGNGQSSENRRGSVAPMPHGFEPFIGFSVHCNRSALAGRSLHFGFFYGLILPSLYALLFCLSVIEEETENQTQGHTRAQRNIVFVYSPGSVTPLKLFYCLCYVYECLCDCLPCVCRHLQKPEMGLRCLGGKLPDVSVGN